MKIKDIVEARMSAAVKLQRAFEREQSKSTASKQRADQAKADFEKEWKAKQEKDKQGVAEGDSGAKYKIKSIGKDKNGDYYISPSTGKKVYKSGVKRGDHENPKTGEHKGVAEGLKSNMAAAALAAANLLGSPAQAAEEPVKPITIAYVTIEGEVKKYNLGDKFANSKEAEKFISGVLDKQGLRGYHLEIKHGYLKQKNEDSAGVGIITKQNITADVDKNTPKKNLRAFKL